MMLSFQPTDDEQTLCDTAHRFAADHVRPLLRSCEEGGVPESLARDFWRLGVGLMSHSEDIGGAALGIRAAVLAEEELAWGDPGVAVGLPRPGLAGEVLSALDLPTQARWLAPFAGRSPASCATALLDPWQEDGADIRLTRRADGGILLTGRAEDVASADRAEWVLVAARERAALTLLAISPTIDGFEFEPDSNRLGLCAARHGTLTLRNCRVEEDCILCGGSRAYAAVEHGLRRDLFTWSARAVGTSRAALEYAVGYARQRQAFGRPIADHQAVGFMIADMAISVDASRALLWQAAWACDTNLPDGAELIAAAAQFAVETVTQVTTNAVQVLGGHGYVKDHPVEKWMRDARCIGNVILQEKILLRLLGDRA